MLLWWKVAKKWKNNGRSKEDLCRYVTSKLNRKLTLKLHKVLWYVCIPFSFARYHSTCSLCCCCCCCCCHQCICMASFITISHLSSTPQKTLCFFSSFWVAVSHLFYLVWYVPIHFIPTFMHPFCSIWINLLLSIFARENMC